MLRVGIVLFPGFQVMNLGMTSVLEFANLEMSEPLYDFVLLSEHGGPVRCSSGFEVTTQPFDDSRFDTILVVGDNDRNPSPPSLIEFLKRAAPRARRVAAACTGAFRLAEAGLLDGRRATTHWSRAAELARAYPQITVEPDRIFIREGAIWTSAGITAGIDLALALVAEDHGELIAKRAAQHLVVYHRRPGGQSQFSALLEADRPDSRFSPLLAWARERLGERLSVERLADRAAMSPRHFARTFAAETGATPAKAIERLRLEAARERVEGSAEPIERVAAQTGFRDPERMRRSFIRAFGQPPQTLRRSARTAAAAD